MTERTYWVCGHCNASRVSSSWEHHPRDGEILKCPKCGKPNYSYSMVKERGGTKNGAYQKRIWGKYVGGYDGGYRYFRMTKNPLLHRLKKASRVAGYWKRQNDSQRDRVYVTCPNCGSIGSAESQEVHPDQTLGCIVCATCQAHYFPRLVGWKTEPLEVKV